MAGIIFGLSAPEALERFSELVELLLEVNEEITPRMFEKLRTKADELGVHQLDYNLTLWQAIQKNDGMGHDFTTNEQFIPIGVSCPRCDEKLHEPTVSCPACGWEFCFSLDDGISEEKNDHYWVYWRNTQLADDDSQIKDSCKVAGQGDAQATNTNLAYKKVRVYELAKEAGMTSKVLTEKLLELGYDLKGPSSTVNEAVADDIRSRLFNKYLHPPKTQEKEIFTQNRVTIIRRRHN